MKLKTDVVGVVTLALILSACGGSSQQSKSLSQAILDQPNCDSNRDRVWEELYRQVDLYGNLPDSDSVASEVSALAHTTPQSDAMNDAYREIAQAIRGQSPDEAVKTLAEIEIGDRTSSEKAYRQTKIENALSLLKVESIAADGTCTQVIPDVSPAAIDAVPLFETWRGKLNTALYGAYKTFSVAYQTCSALSVATFKASTALVSGITITGKHANGVGSKRQVTNATTVFNTNPYYSSRVSPGKGCFTVEKSPLIYDYGGKPYASSALGTIDLFKNAGTGTTSLGIDCSGFVASSVLVSGLRLKSGVANKAAQSGGTNAAMFANPVGNGLSCFAPLISTKTATLRPGDIVANGGHVFMIDSVGADPFGIANAKTAAQCNAVTAAKFDFTLIQSSPSKGGIGLNRYKGVDYLATTSSFRSGLEAYAKSICQVKLGIIAQKTLANRTLAVVVRHTGTSSCMDKPVQLAGESCMKSCGVSSARLFAVGTFPPELR